MASGLDIPREEADQAPRQAADRVALDKESVVSIDGHPVFRVTLQGAIVFLISFDENEGMPLSAAEALHQALEVAIQECNARHAQLVRDGKWEDGGGQDGEGGVRMMPITVDDLARLLSGRRRSRR